MYKQVKRELKTIAIYNVIVRYLDICSYTYKGH